MVPPTIRLDDGALEDDDDLERPLPELPHELLVSLLGGHGERDRDELDSFVFGGGAEVEDVLNELILDGTVYYYGLPKSTRADTLLALVQSLGWSKLR